MSDTPTNAQDVVAVLNSSFVQVFPAARAIKAAVTRASKVMEHPLETGATIADHRVELPNVIDLSVICSSADYVATYQQIRDLYRRGELLTVQTRVDSFGSMLIEKMPHEEGAEMLDGVAVAITLREAAFVTPQFSSLPARRVARPADADTVKRGQQQPKESARSGSVLSGWFK